MTADDKPSDKPAPPDKGSTGFTGFFINYVNVWVAAAIALPTAITWKGMPMYESQRGILTTYTALSCVLILAFLFFVKNQVNIKLKAKIGVLGLIGIPFLLICAASYCGYKYQDVLVGSVPYTQKHFNEIYKDISIEDIHDGGSIIMYYILTMVFAEAALFFMASREWRPKKK